VPRLESRGVFSVLLLLLSACASPVPPEKSGVTHGRALDFTELAASPAVGWYSEAARDGRVRIRRDDSVRCEGIASISIDVLQPTSPAAGRASISQVLDTADSPCEMRFSLELMGEVAGEVVLAAYVWDSGVARCLAQTDVYVSESWRPCSVQFSVPIDNKRVGLFVYLPDAGTGSLWLGRPRLESVSE